jgi:endonuclease/exonuclease/phosphatase family metal-dependent hydrolase
LSRKLLIIAAALVAPAALAPAAAQARDVTVMTRNVYLGADLIPLATAPADQFRHAAAGVFDSVVAGDPDGRMKLIAGEIAHAKPDLVGLQEVSLWRTGATNPASTVRYDFSRAILARLKRLHAGYRLAVLERGFNVEGPTDQGYDVRLTLGDAILVRKGVKVSHVRAGVFKHQLTIPTNGIGPVQATRGWNALDAQVGRTRFHFVNVHLEAYNPTTRLQQAKELAAGPLKSERTTILVGDLNSGPDLPQAADRPPYQAIARAGFKPERSAKDSCCFNDDLETGAWDHNVDWIMARPKVKLVRSSVTGAETTAAGLHPSDHCGLVSTLRLG